MPFAKAAPAEKTAAPAKTAPAAAKVSANPPKTTPTSAAKSSAPAAASAPASAAKPAAESELGKQFFQAQLSFYTEGAKFFKMYTDGKLHLPVVGTSAPSKPAATPPVSGVKTPASAPATSAKSAAPAAKAAAPAAKPAATSAPKSPEGTDYNTWTRLQLVEKAKELGIDHTGKKREDLAKMVAEAMAGDSAAPAGGDEEALDETTQKMADINADLISENLDKFEQYTDSTLPEDQRPEGWLGCDGVCSACPNPEAHPSRSLQIQSCYKVIHEQLGLEPELLAAA